MRYQEYPYDPRQVEQRMQQMALGADMARSVHALTVRIADYKEVMQRLHNELELIHQEFTAHDTAGGRKEIDRLTQAKLLQMCLNAAYGTGNPQIIKDTLAELGRYIAAMPNYGEETLRFVVARKTGGSYPPPEAAYGA
jgi:hypothetical protein